MFRKNWLGETKIQELNRRIRALEAHVGSLDERYAELEGKYNVLTAEMRRDNTSEE